MRTSILGTYFLATAAEHYDGMMWYYSANDQAQQLSIDFAVSMPTVVGVIAALSPSNAWGRNITDAHNIIRSYVEHGRDDAIKVRVGTYNVNKDKAIRILDGSDPLDTLGGIKVRSFYRLILNPLADDVCIDGHAYSIWKGERVATTKVPKITPRLYETIQQDYRDCANVVSEIKGRTILPSQMQAITWTVHRNLYKRARG